MIRRLCPQVTVMMEGSVAAQGTLDEVARLPDVDRGLSRQGAGMSAPLLAVDDVHAGYQSGVDILQGMSLDVPAGSFVLVIGPNGAGKSTLLKTIFGLLQAASRRRSRFAGQSIASLAPHEIKRLGVSYVPQELNTFPHAHGRGEPEHRRLDLAARARAC